MDFLVVLSRNILEWWPWLNLLSDSFFIQLVITYTFFLIFFSKNIFYVTFYFFILILYFGLFLCIYQLELFTGFLWLVECVVIFVFLLFLFFIKTVGTWNRLQIKLYNFIYLGVFLGFIILIFSFSYPNYIEHFVPTELNIIDLWDDYYEALNNTNVNDLVAFLISYYTFNSFELIIIGVMILIASLVCVNLNRIVKNTKVQNIGVFLQMFNFFKDLISSFFIRQQNLVDQENQVEGTRFFKKK